MPGAGAADLPAIRLSDAAIADHERDGFVLVRDPWPSGAMAKAGEWIAELAGRPDVSGRHWVYREQSLADPAVKLISRIENFAPFHAGLAAVAVALAPAAGRLLGAEAVLFKDKINFKMPGGDGFKPHQDSQAGWDTYAKTFVSIAVAVDSSTQENGCLEVAAGHHRRGLFDLWRPLSAEEMAGMEFQLCPMDPGDLVFLGSHTPHGSKPNFSAVCRRMMFLTYNRADEGDHRAQYYADKHKGYPPDIDREAGKSYVFKV
ncbi:MAG: phytanoyl-CoA dioxygenase family protein [Alphaproteobacteria bacterium]|nr:phytanoyl-CoA dioxygenase family protein [Alphaproteobacteria bacterium]